MLFISRVASVALWLTSNATGSEWDEKRRQEWLIKELTSKRPLMPPSLEFTPEVADVINTFRTISNLPPDSLAAYVISMAHTASDVLAVVLLQARLEALRHQSFPLAQVMFKG